MTEKIVWQPFGLWGSKQSFGVLMNEDFARKMIRLKISKERQRRTNELGSEELQRSDIDWKRPYQFHEDSGFVEGFYLGRDGAWLSIESYVTREDLLRDERRGKPIKYFTHNVYTLEQRNALLNLTDLWVRLSDVMGEAS